MLSCQTEHAEIQFKRENHRFSLNLIVLESDAF